MRLVMMLLLCACATIPPCENQRIPKGYTQCRETWIRAYATPEEIAEAHADDVDAGR